MNKAFIIVLLWQLQFSTLSAQPSPSEEMQRLNFLIGDWDVQTEARLSMNGPWEKANAEASFLKTLQGTLIEEEFKGTRQGKPFLAKTFFAFNNLQMHFQRVFIDAPHGILMQYEGPLSNDSLVFRKTLMTPNGSRVKLQVIYLKLSDDNFLVESMRMPAGATRWDVTSRFVYTRKKKSI